MDNVDLRIVAPLITASAALVLWVIKEFVQWRQRALSARQIQINLVRALYAEIDFNVRDMARFRQRSPAPSVWQAKLAQNAGLVPHITDARHTEIYRARMPDIHLISDEVMQATVNFYGLLEKIKSQIDGVAAPSFGTISLKGKVNAVDIIRRTAVEAETAGKRLLWALEKENPKMRLKRFRDDA